ncbi:tyrosine-type recombinase/integrase [Cupriavidus basilensis]|uniref:Tyrosine-type recombinase/integrase n=1 Tax=Cupriavidus basilensis TaxID=68895 RepID=A0A643FIN7_9BURK|nr:tyrosine-type recombinase/integrase [Cupriavidus basilensis]QOT74862.1 tyrosine-type recombinase/integrase [Cupriavidus basilensis]
MISRRKTPDGLPFRLYRREGKFKVSYGYKLPDGKWAFRLSAQRNNAEAVAEIDREARRRADELNGDAVLAGTTQALFDAYFSWQEGLPEADERKKAAVTLTENRVEAKTVCKVFGKVKPAAIKPHHIYRYLDLRAKQGAPAKANKEVALLSATLEYGRRLGELERNPCTGIKYNPTKPRQKYVRPEEVALAVEIARVRGGSYLILALCVQTAYLTVSRPEEMRSLVRQAITPDGLLVPVGKRKAGQMQRTKVVRWSPALRQAVDEALALQRTASVYVFGNTSGQVYSRSGWNTIWKRLMGYCGKAAEERGVTFSSFTLADMRPSAVTDRMEEGDDRITDATGHADGKMVAKIYDRRRVRKVRPTA